jgi:hypothetical protein
MVDSRIGSVSFVALEAGANVPVGGNVGGFLLAYTLTAQGLSSILAAQNTDAQTHRCTDAQAHSCAAAQAHRFAIYLYVPYQPAGSPQYKAQADDFVSRLQSADSQQTVRQYRMFFS